MSRLNRLADRFIVAGSRVAVVFNNDFADMLVKKYGMQGLKQLSGKYYRSPSDIVTLIYKNFEYDFSGQGIILTEWMLQSMANGSGELDDWSRFVDVAKFYIEHHKDPKFTNAIKQIDEEGSSDTIYGTRSKSILIFSLDDLEDMKYLYFLDPNELKISNKIPTGSNLVYTGKKYQIVKTSSVEAACNLASGTKWCTSGEEKAREYLKKGPLYIIYMNGKKFAQLHVTREGNEFGDLRNRQLFMGVDLRSILVDLGVLI